LKKRTISIVAFALAILFLVPFNTLAIGNALPCVGGEGEELPCASAILMDAESGCVLFEQNADDALPPASVTKIMTLLLVMEAIDAGKIALEDTVTASANAASMGGSQIFLKEGERMSVEEMLKSVIIASANDCAVALAEFLCGSEEGFVAAMNARAVALGMKNTHFENTNGLDDTVQNHVTSARDIAIMSRELIKYPKILEYSGKWMDSVRDGAFGLTNTNRLVRFYRGCTGLKTGSTSRAGFCISATAQREGLSLICVIMAAPTRDVRNATAARLLDYGFANYTTFRAEAGERILPVIGGGVRDAVVRWPSLSITVPKEGVKQVQTVFEIPQALEAPLKAGEVIGAVKYVLDGKEIGCTLITLDEDINKISFGGLFRKILSSFLLL
jgi:D-alanyl-D-alanine carboxypeptidase (penicillin-binding protein 5/6)